MADIRLEKENDRYLAVKDNKTIAQLLFTPLPGKDAVSIDSIFVDKDYRGQGIAGKILAKAVLDAKKDGKKIKPICSFARAAFLRNPEYQKIRYRDDD